MDNANVLKVLQLDVSSVQSDDLFDGYLKLFLNSPAEAEKALQQAVTTSQPGGLVLGGKSSGLK